MWFSPGGESHDRFVALFDESALRAAFEVMGHLSVCVCSAKPTAVEAGEMESEDAAEAEMDRERMLRALGVDEHEWEHRLKWRY